MAETLRGGALMIFGATPLPSNVLAAFILLLGLAGLRMLCGKKVMSWKAF
jgi:hypothetical protein